MAASQISFNDLQLAVQKRDPAFVQLFSSFLNQDDPSIPSDASEGNTSFYSFKWDIQSSWDLRMTAQGDERMKFRQEKWEQFLSQEYGVHERFKCDRLLIDLLEEDGEWGRQTLLQLISTIPLKWGPWRAIKQLFKHAESKHDYEIIGAIAARCDYECSNSSYGRDVTSMTLAYMRRRGWRYLRDLGRNMPTLYPIAAIHFLRWYPNQTDSWQQGQFWRSTWIANHIFFHQHKNYGSTGFQYGNYYNKMPTSLSKYKAYPETWKTSFGPLMDLLLLCRSAHVSQFATDVLQEEFEKEIRSIPLEHLIRLGQRTLGPIQKFVKNRIESNPALQKAQFVDNGLHELILNFFLTSQDEDVRAYAIQYAKDYAKEMSIETLLSLLAHGFDNLNGFVKQQISQRDPREELGLSGIQRLLLFSSTFDLAQKLLKKAFQPKELTLDWFEPLLFADDSDVITFAVNYLKKEYPNAQIETAWLQTLIADKRMEDNYYTYIVREYVQSKLQQRAKQLDPTWIQEALLHDNWRGAVQNWIDEGKIQPSQLDLGWFKALTHSTLWSAHPWVAEQKDKPNTWVEDLSFPYSLQSFAIRLLRRAELFRPQDIGLDWLLQQLLLDDTDNTSMAEHLLLEYFTPSDFAPAEEVAALPEAEETSQAATSENPLVGKTFLFTGKLKQLSRTEAVAKVSELDGKVAKSVTKKLDYLVVGDDGSPLFSGGKKGSKIVKAEEYQEQGLGIQIISETDWLQMLSQGGASTADTDPRVIALGFEYLYQLCTQEEQPEAIRIFASQYIQAKHPILGPIQTGHPLEGEHVIPRSMYTAQHFLGRLEDPREEVRQLALRIARYELKNWSVPSQDIFALCESSHEAARSFAIEALMGKPEDHEKDSKEDFYYSPQELDSNLVFALTENRRMQVRQAGIVLLSKHYSVLDGDQKILRLAESPDRDIRAQAVRILWQRYRRPATTTRGWTPNKDHRSQIQPNAPSESLTGQDLLLGFVKTVLFGIPPGRLKKQPKNMVRPWKNSKAKVHMIELLRDLALEDQELYKMMRPVFEQFLASHHKTESLACLVALTQLDNRWLDAA